MAGLGELTQYGRHTVLGQFSNVFTECLREIGLEAKAQEVAYPVSEYSTYTRFCKTLAGEEIYRAYVFGNDPHRQVRYVPSNDITIIH